MSAPSAVRVKILHAIASAEWAFQAGEVLDVPRALAQQLVTSGAAVRTDEAPQMRRPGVCGWCGSAILTPLGEGVFLCGQCRRTTGA